MRDRKRFLWIPADPSAKIGKTLDGFPRLHSTCVSVSVDMYTSGRIIKGRGCELFFDK